jgi:hypothetical protein
MLFDLTDIPIRAINALLKECASLELTIRRILLSKARLKPGAVYKTGLQPRVFAGLEQFVLTDCADFTINAIPQQGN